MTCRCKAYEWPHRMGYGLCDARPSDPDVPVCPECGSDNTVGDSREEPAVHGSSDVLFNRCRTCGHEWDHQ